MKQYRLLFSALLLLVFAVSNTTQAQNVTVRPDNGSMIATRKSGGGDTFFNWGGFSTWKHEQLALTMTTGDSNNNLTDNSNGLTASGQLANHANDIFASADVTLNYITYVSGGTTYYLNIVNNQPRFTTDKTTTWEVNAQGYVHSGNSYLVCSASGNPRTLSIGNSNSQRRLQIDNNGRLYYQDSGWFSTTTYYLHGTTSASTTPTLTTNNQNEVAMWTVETGSTGTKYLQLGKGRDMNTYMTIALPKGYRFTGYTIKFHRINQPTGATGTIYEYNYNACFGETNTSFDYTTTTNSTDQSITSFRGEIPQNNTTSYTIGRTSQSDTDMGNVLYFKLGTQDNSGNQNTVNNRVFIQFDYIELLFTAEANYAPVTPTTSTTERSAVDISFTTSKMNYGSLTSQTDGGRARISYNGTITDLNANLTLYEDGSVEKVDDNGFDGTAGNIVKYQSGSISSAGNYFKLDGHKHGKLTSEGEAIYFIETPIWVTSGSGTNVHKDPIGYRIVGATFDYAAGTDHTYYPATFYIRYESTGHGEGQDGIYGLNYYSGEYNWTYQTVWRIDEDGYIFWGTSSQMYYLAVGNDGKINVVTEKPSADAGTFEVINNQIRRKNYPTQYIGWEEKTATYIDDEGNEQIVFELDDDGNPTGVPRIIRSAVITESTNNRSYYDEQTSAGGGTTGKYTLRIYDPTGTKVICEKVVEGVGGRIDINDYTNTPYNNDAIKIGIVGTGLINGHLTLQALDPYIDHLDIVCQESGGNGGKLTQQFNATDFSVRGGKFTFYVPENFDFPVKFTFENLYSKYGDNTYYNANNDPELHGRYYFVGSTYSGYENNDVYARYNNTAHRNADYTTKIACLQPGNKKYTFNNAATVGTSGGAYEEYPFNVALYGAEGGAFTDFEFSQDEMTDGTVKTAYLFTCDETRYNIAPTTATQHVYYAFYEMTIDMKKKDYRPIFDWVKIYDETFYSPNGSDIIRDPQWGLKIKTEDVIDDQGTHSGYLTVSKILDVIQNGLPAQQGSPAVQGLDNTGTNAPKSMNQILYIDGSNLMNIVENQTTTDGTTTTHRLSSLKEGLAANALIYLPYGSTSSDDNFAYNTVAKYSETPFFRGAGNVVITDKNPFFAPYDIQVDAQKYAEYKRLITPMYDMTVQLCTVILPFSISVTESDGKYLHTNNNNMGSFYLHQINENNALAQGSEGSAIHYEYGHVGYFGNPKQDYIETAGQTITAKANVPYVVDVKDAPSVGEQLSFIAHVNGAKISATPWGTSESVRGIFTGETASATVDGNSIKFTNKGTFRGKIYPYEDEQTGEDRLHYQVFYFAKNYFLNSTTLRQDLDLYILPFRAFYDYTGTLAGVQGFRFVFGENETDPSSVAALKRNADLAVTAGKGTITFMAKADNDVAVISTNGTMVNKVSLKSGETRTIQLPAGIYLINGMKIVVR